MPSANCFDAPTLKNYLLGKLSDDQSDVVAAHLEACLNCEATVAELDRASDTLTCGLRLPAIAAEPVTDDALQNALDKVQSLELAAEHNELSKSGADRSPVLRDYRLLEPLGFGGMGTVYKAVHTRLDRLVAVKLLPARRLGDEQAVARFQREMRVIGQLSHPAIVQATDAGEVDGTHFLVMEYVEGFDLNTIAKACGLLSIADACEIARQAALGLEYAHQQGVVHRDIKPSNLMLSRGEGRGARGEASDLFSPLAPHPSPLLKILDLGLALLSGEQAPVDELTTVGQLMGTLDYMAPEQLEDSHLVGPRADIYALAATLYRLLTGVAPFVKDDRKTPLQKLRALATQSAPPIRERRADVPEELAAIIDRALRRESAERFASMTEFAAALTPWCAGHDLSQLVGQVPDLPGTEVESPCARRGSPEPAAWLDHRSPSASFCTIKTEPNSGDLRSVATAGSEDPRRALDEHVENVPHGSSPRRTLLITLAVLFLAALGIVITIETNKGTLIVESLRDGVEVRVKKSGKTVERLELTTGPKSARLAAGEYEIEILGDADGLQIQNGKFVLKRGDTVIAKVTEQPLKVIGSSGPDPAMLTSKPTIAPQTLGQDGDGVAGQATNAPSVEPDDEKPNPTAKSIDQGLASHPDHAGETKYRKALTTPVDLKFEDISLEDGLQFLQEFASVPIWLDKAALAEEGLATDTPVTLKLIGVSLGTALRFTLRPLNLTSFWDGTSIRVTTLAKAKEQLVSRSYPVGRSLPMVRKAVRLRQEQAIKAVLDAGGNLRQLPGGGGGGGGGFFAVPTPRSHVRQNVGAASTGPRSGERGYKDDSLDDRLHFQFGGGGGFGGGVIAGGQGGGGTVSPNQQAAGYFGELFALLTDASWMTTDGEGGTLQLLGDVLIIRQTRPVHEQIEAMLRVLEQASTGPLPKSPVEIRRPDYPFEADQTLREKLSKPVDFEMQDSSLSDALQFLEDFTQTRILVDQEKLTDEGVATDAPVTASLKNLPFQVVLHRLLDPLNLTADVEEGLLVVTSKSALQQRLVLKGYEIRDLCARGVEEQELLAGLESGTTGPWINRHGEGGGLMVFADRLLFVTQTRQNHEEVEAFLRDLRSQLSEQPRKKPLAQAKPQPTPKTSTPAATNNPGTARPTTTAQPANDPKQPRYDGKTFDEWLAVLDVERSPARLADAIEALRLLGRDTHAQQIAERVLKVSRVIDFAPAGGNNNRPSIYNEAYKLFSNLPDAVAQRAFANELRNGTVRSRRFVLEYAGMWHSSVSEEFFGEVLKTCGDSDPKIRELAITLLRWFPLDDKLAKLNDQRTQQLRRSLNDSVLLIAYLAASDLLDSEPDSKSVAETLARIVEKTTDPDRRWQALRLIAVMGPRAAPVAAKVSAVLLEKPADEHVQLNSQAQIWLAQFAFEKDRAFQAVAAVALARMGDAAKSELPKIDEAIKNAPLETIDRKGRDLDEALTFRDLLSVVKFRVQPPQEFDLRGGDLKLIQSAIDLLALNHQLCQLEKALLQSVRAEKHPSVKTLDERVTRLRGAFHDTKTLLGVHRFMDSKDNRDDPKEYVRDLVTSLASTSEPIAPLDHNTGLTILAGSLVVTLIKELGRLGPAARDALPELKKRAKSLNKDIATAAEEAIKQIEDANNGDTK